MHPLNSSSQGDTLCPRSGGSAAARICVAAVESCGIVCTCGHDERSGTVVALDLIRGSGGGEGVGVFCVRTLQV